MEKVEQPRLPSGAEKSPEKLAGEWAAEFLTTSRLDQWKNFLLAKKLLESKNQNSEDCSIYEQIINQPANTELVHAIAKDINKDPKFYDAESTSLLTVEKNFVNTIFTKIIEWISICKNEGKEKIQIRFDIDRTLMSDLTCPRPAAEALLFLKQKLDAGMWGAIEFKTLSTRPLHQQNELFETGNLVFLGSIFPKDSRISSGEIDMRLTNEQITALFKRIAPEKNEKQALEEYGHSVAFFNKIYLMRQTPESLLIDDSNRFAPILGRQVAIVLGFD